MNFFSAFTSEVFRPLVSLLLPGSLALSTWVIALTWKYPHLRELMSQNHTETAVLLTLAVTFAGMVIEDLGTRVEVMFDDWSDDKSGEQHTQNWYAYLRTSFQSDPIGRRYARSLVLRLKFELGAGFGFLFALGGLIWLTFLGLQLITFSIIGLLFVIGSLWEFFESFETHKLLGEVRAELLKSIRIVQ